MSGGGSHAITRDVKTGSLAKKFDPDLLPWEKQPNETDNQYEGFRAFRDSTDRKVGDHGSSSYQWSSMWSWGWRAYQWDLHVAREDDHQMVRHRLEMNRQHRDVARAALSKVAQWLVNMNPDTMKPSEAARWFEVAVRVQREASGLSGVAEDPYATQDEDAPDSDRTLAEALGIDILDEDAAAVALYRAVNGP